MRARLILNVDHEMQRTPDKEQTIVSGDKRLQYLKQATFFYLLNLNDICFVCDIPISSPESASRSLKVGVTKSQSPCYTKSVL